MNPATPTPVTRPPTTFTPSGASAAYTSSQMSPAPTVAVPAAASYATSLKRAIAICTPSVDEKPGFDECPPPLTCATAAATHVRSQRRIARNGK